MKLIQLRIAFVFVLRAVVVALLLVSAQAKAAFSEWVDIHVENGALWLDTKVAGISGYTMIDSGAQINAINSGFLRAYDQKYATGPAVTILGIYGKSERRTYNSVPVELFGSTVNFKRLVDIDFGGDQEQLIIGAPFLKLYVFQFDYPNKRMRVITRDSIDLKKVKNLKSRSDSKTGDPIVKVRLNDEKDLWLQLDTGNSGGIILERGIAEGRKWLEKYPTTLVRGRGATSTGQSEQFSLPKFEIGDFELADVIVKVPAKGEDFELFERETRTGSRFRKSRSQSRGILGYDVLKHFIVTVDYKGGHVHLEAPAPAGSNP